MVYSFEVTHEVVYKITTLVVRLENLLPYKVKCIRNDGGTEFGNSSLEDLCNSRGIVFQKSNVDSQEENGSAERSHQTEMGKVRCA